MATVIFMKINKNQAAIIADESSWHLGHVYGYRRNRYGDSIMPLTDENAIKNLGCAGIYAGTGFPSFHFEVTNKSISEINRVQKSMEFEELVDLVQGNYQDVHQRYINDKLNFFFGFNQDELNSLKFNSNGKDIEIKQSEVISEAKKVIKHGNKNDAYERIYGNQGVVLGFDKKNGINSYYVGNGYKGINFAFPLSSFGYGATIVSTSYADMIKSVPLSERREGYSLLEGLYTMLSIATQTKKYVGRMGGYFQMYILDGLEKPENMIREYSNDSLHLLSEIVGSSTMNFIKKKDAIDFIDKILFKSADFEKTEKDFFKKSRDLEKMKMYLYGYKVDKLEK